jgi:citrate synthase
VSSDHEGGNVSAHTAHLVSSSLSDPYLSFSAAMNGLAGPRHGLANQECLRYLLDFKEKYKGKWSDDDIRDYVEETIDRGKVVPGYGHAVLRKTDPRFVCEIEFADEYIKDDINIKLVKDFYRVIPEALLSQKAVKNPFPNVDAGSGALLMHYGMT